jgi:hypothetical protein
MIGEKGVKRRRQYNMHLHISTYCIWLTVLTLVKHSLTALGLNDLTTLDGPKPELENIVYSGLCFVKRFFVF